MNTIEQEAPAGRRRRRRYSREFKAQVVAACQGPGVSIAAIALHHKLNANLLRRWVDQAEGNVPAPIVGGAVAVQPAAMPAFVPVPLGVIEWKGLPRPEVAAEAASWHRRAMMPC